MTIQINAREQSLCKHLQLSASSDTTSLITLSKKIANLSEREKARFDELTSKLAHRSIAPIQSFETLAADIPLATIAKTAFALLVKKDTESVTDIYNNAAYIAWKLDGEVLDRGPYWGEHLLEGNQSIHEMIQVHACGELINHDIKMHILSFLPEEQAKPYYLHKIERLLGYLTKNLKNEKNHTLIHTFCSAVGIDCLINEAGSFDKNQAIELLQQFFTEQKEYAKKFYYEHLDFTSFIQTLLSDVTLFAHRVCNFYEDLPSNFKRILSIPTGWGEMQLANKAETIISLFESFQWHTINWESLAIPFERVQNIVDQVIQLGIQWLITQSETISTERFSFSELEALQSSRK